MRAFRCGCTARPERVGVRVRWLLVQPCAKHERERAPLEGGR